MDHITAPLHKTQLNDRVLWSDGDSTYISTDIVNKIRAGVDTSGMFTDVLTDEIKQYNKFVDPKDQILVKVQCNPNDFSWNVPEEYMNLDVVNYVSDKLNVECQHLSAEEYEIRAFRVARELKLFKTLDLYNILRVIIYTINTFKYKNVVWGVGRGSSVSSYVLYLIGVHDVDSVMYDLDISDFLRE